MSKSTTSPTPRAGVAYVRVSTDEQVREGVSLDVQRERIRQYAASRGITLTRTIHADEGFSGRKSSNRPGLAAAIEEAIAGKAVLIVYSLSRFARSTRDCLTLCDRLVKGGADLISITESIDTTSAHGRFFRTMLAAMAELESDQTSERVRAAVAHKRKLGEWYGFTAFGKRADAHGKLVADAVELATLNVILAMRATRTPYAEILRWLTAAGVRNRRGKPYAPQAIYRLVATRGRAKGLPDVASAKRSLVAAMRKTPRRASRW